MMDPYAEACFDAIPWINVATGAKSFVACKQAKTPGIVSAKVQVHRLRFRKSTDARTKSNITYEIQLSVVS